MLRPDRATRFSTGAVRRPVIEHACVAVALAAAGGAYRLVVAGDDWWLTAALVSTAVTAVCGALEALRTVRESVAGTVLAPAAGAAAALWLCAWIFVPATLLGPLPTPASVSALADLFVRGGVLAMQEAAPAAAARPLVLVLVAAFAALALLAHLLLRWRRGVTAIGVLGVAVLVVPALIAGRTPATEVVLVAAAAWLVLLRVRTEPRAGRAGLVPAIAIGAAGLAGAAVLPPVLPDVTAVARPWGEPPPEVFGRGINPMVQLGQNLRRNSTAVAARYTTTLDDPPYLKVAVLRDFTGETWRPAEAGPADPFEGAIDLDRDVERSTETTDVVIEDLTSTMLPVPYPAQRVEGLEGSWRWQRAGLVLSSQEATTRDQTYSVQSLQREPTAAQLRAGDAAIGPALEPYVTLVDDVPDVVRTTAAEVTAGAGSDYDRALALQDHLRGNFVYDEQAPVAEDYDGNGLDVLAEFLQRRAGYCVHFSSAMAVMARELGIPARIAVGYAPGSPVDTEEESGRTVYEVTSNDLHAWPELYFRGVGWVSFEPTPAVGTGTSFADPQSPQQGDAAQPAPSDQDPERPDVSEREGEQDEAGTRPSEAAPMAPRAVAVVAAAALFAAASPALWRAARRRRRLHGPRASAWWLELEDTATDLGLQAVGGTPRATAAQLRTRSAELDGGALAAVVEAVEAERFARPGTPVPDERARARTLVRELERSVSTSRRVAARLLPRSLWTWL